jgi:hypothetical protein
MTAQRGRPARRFFSRIISFRVISCSPPQLLRCASETPSAPVSEEALSATQKNHRPHGAASVILPPPQPCNA